MGSVHNAQASMYENSVFSDPLSLQEPTSALCNSRGLCIKNMFTSMDMYVYMI